MAGTFEIRKRTDGQFEFALKAANGTTVVTSKPHDTREAVMGASLAVRTLAADAELVDLTGEVG